MTDSKTDAIAREAARLLEAGRSAKIGDAIRAAAESLGLHDAGLPGHGRVRKHAQAMAMQALGSAGYAESVRDVWRAAERLMTVLDEAMPGVDPVLVGRAATGHVDAGVTVHIRVYTAASVGELAGVLVEFGYDEPVFETARTRLGRLSRLRLVDDGIQIVVTRLLPHMAQAAGTDLFTGRPLATATLDDLRRRLQSH